MEVELMIRAKKINLKQGISNFNEIFEIMKYLELQHQIKFDFKMIVKN